MFICKIVKALPIPMRMVAVRSYLQMNFSFKRLIERNMLKIIASAQVVVNKETSANGSVNACPKLAIIIGITPRII